MKTDINSTIPSSLLPADLIEIAHPNSPSWKGKLWRIVVRVTQLSLVTVLLLALVLWLINNVFFGGLNAGQQAPDFSLNDLKGNVVHLSDYHGQPIMLTFWSPDCHSCLEELPALQSLTKNPNSNFILLTVVSNTPREKLGAFVHKQQLSFPVLVDEQGKISEIYKVRAIPFSYLINLDGVIQQKVIGGNLLEQSQNQLRAWLKACSTNQQCQ